MSNSWSRKVPRLTAETAVAANETGGHVDRVSGPVEPSPYLAGEVIGDRYRLVRELGRGGMGVVWVGYALALGVDVAVKLIRTSAASPAVSSRMAREAHAAARLGHPALVRVFDFGWTSRGDPYLVMELVQGETLSACLERENRISAIRAVQLLLPIADGLRLAHDRTIVHRDIKPDNIFLATDTLGRIQPKLLDFGIAKVGPATVDARLTQVGVVLGSPQYMSPEQALGVDDVDERTDVWSLAVVLYEMVTGAMPFEKANYNALMQAIIHEPTKPMTDFAEGDESLWQVVERGLAKDRENRWATMAELGEALALWLYEHGIKEDICGNSIRAVWLDGVSCGGKIATPLTVPPNKGVRVSEMLAHSASARTVQRKRPGLASRVWRESGQRTLVFVAITFGVMLGGIIVALLFRSQQRVADKTDRDKQHWVQSRSPANLAAGVSGEARVEAGVSDMVATPVENLPKEIGGDGVSKGVVEKSRANAVNPKTSTKGTKRRHDFGF